MALMIRLRQQGRKNRQTYRLVATERSVPRGGKYVECLGWYDPFASGEKNLLVKEERVQFWLERGAIMTHKAKCLIKRAAPEMIKKWNEKKIKRS